MVETVGGEMRGAVERLPILIVNPHSRCNCRCAMCDIWKDTSAREISPEHLESQLPGMDALGVEWVVFSGGEPLMHSDLFRLCRIVKTRPRRVSLLSSGLLLKRYAREITTHVDDVIVSLDGPPQIHDRVRGVPGAFEALRAGIAALRECDPGYKVSGRCTVQRSNCASLIDTVQAARALGLNSLSFLAADLESTAFNHAAGWDEARRSSVALGEGDLGLLEREIEALIDSRDASAFVVEPAAKLRRIVSHFRAYLGHAEPAAPVCNAPWVSAVVEADGSVRPCFFHPPIGSLRVAGLLDVVNGPAAAAFRGALDIEHDPVCRKCVCSLHRPPQ